MVLIQEKAKNLLENLLFRISDYSVVSTSISVIYFGGYGGSALDIVAEYKDHTWTQLGTLNQRRDGHSSIQMDNKIFILGGWGVKWVTNVKYKIY